MTMTNENKKVAPMIKTYFLIILLFLYVDFQKESLNDSSIKMIFYVFET